MLPVAEVTHFLLTRNAPLIVSLAALTFIPATCADPSANSGRPPLDARPSEWVQSIKLSEDSPAKKIGETQELLITSVTSN